MVPPHLVKMPVAIPFDGEGFGEEVEEGGEKEEEEAVGVMARADDDKVGVDERVTKNIILVVDGIGEGQLQPLLEAVGLMNTHAETVEVRRLAHAAAAAEGLRRILKKNGVGFVSNMAVLTAVGKEALKKVAGLFQGLDQMVCELVYAWVWVWVWVWVLMWVCCENV